MKNTALIVLLISFFALSACNRKAPDAMESARQKFVQTNWDETIRHCNEILEENPRDVEALVLRGRAYIDKGNLVYAIHDFTAASKIDPKNAEPLFHRAIAFNKLGKKDQALADAERARKIDPAYAKAFLNDLPASYTSLDEFFEKDSKKEADEEKEDERHEESQFINNEMFANQQPTLDLDSFDDITSQKKKKDSQDSSILSSLPANSLKNFPPEKEISSGSFDHLLPPMISKSLKSPIDFTQPSDLGDSSLKPTDSSTNDSSKNNKNQLTAKKSKTPRPSSGSLPDYYPRTMGPGFETYKNFYQAGASFSTGIQSNQTSQNQVRSNASYWMSSPWNQSYTNHILARQQSPTSRIQRESQRTSYKPYSNFSPHGSLSTPAAQYPGTSWQNGIIYPQTSRTTGITRQLDQ